MNPRINSPDVAAPSPSMDPELQKVIEARHHDPFAVLGRHRRGADEIVRVLLPRAESVSLHRDGPAMTRIPNTDLFEQVSPSGTIPEHYMLYWVDRNGRHHQSHDPYRFAHQIPDFDIHLFAEGKHWHIYRLLGAHPHEVDGAKGFLFATWAPNAQRVSVVGDFNDWNGCCHPMRIRGSSGIWELFIPDLQPGALYKFEIRNRHSGHVFVKSDPYGQQFERRPKTASVLRVEGLYKWSDGVWLKKRRARSWMHEPMSVYEIHLGSWRRDESGNFMSYRELAEHLLDYVQEMGFTHIELMPIGEHPLDASWGYQSTGYFAPTSRHGSPDDFRYFIDVCHRRGIGVILDWVPAHFPKDAHALARFDGTALYEHEDPRLGEHRDWGTLIYNYGRNEVKNFLLASALYWLEEFHLDGLRVDAVASMLYLDYSRDQNDWIPNVYGSNENLDAIEFLRELNSVIHDQYPGCIVVAEESTAWPQVTRPTWTGGLGFSMKWNMGWMHDTLNYMSKDPVHRMHHHNWLTFGLVYAFTENFVLPFSHDEVVHGKKSLLRRMPGDEWQRFANLRLLYTFMFSYPGKKLLFMGSEFAQESEWDFAAELDWEALDYPFHQGIKTLVADLNRLYRHSAALHHFDFDHAGFEWIDCHDSTQSVLSFLRKTAEELMVIVLNFTPVPRHAYRIGVPSAGNYQEVFNSDSTYYGGTNVGNGWVASDETPWMGHKQSVVLTLPPLGGIILSANQQSKNADADHSIRHQ